MSGLTVDTRELAAAVGWAAKTLPARPSLPTLACILIEARDGRIDLSGFDYDAHSRATIEAVGDLTGRWLISGKLAEAVVKTFDPRKPTVLTVDGAKVHLRCGTAKVSLPTMPVEDYPTLPTMPQPAGTVDAKMFADAVGRVTPATGNYATPPWLAGCHLAGGDQLSIIATDRYQVGIDLIDWSPTRPLDVLILAEQLGKLAKPLAESGDTITLSQSDGVFGMSTPGRTAVVRRLERVGDKGEPLPYPDIRRGQPKRETTVVRVESAALRAAVDRAALVLDPKAAIRITSDGDALNVSAAGNGDVDEEVPAGIRGEPLDVRCNPSYLLTALRNVGATTVDLWFGEPMKPFSVTSADQEEAYRALVVPIRPGAVAQ